VQAFIHSFCKLQVAKILLRALQPLVKNPALCPLPAKGKRVKKRFMNSFTPPFGPQLIRNQAVKASFSPEAAGLPQGTPPQPLWRSVFLKNMELELAIGIQPSEQGRRQRVLVSVELLVKDIPAINGDIGSVVNYDSLVSQLQAYSHTASHIALLETLAEELLGLCFFDWRIEHAFICLEKPDIYPGLASVGIYMGRARPPTPHAPTPYAAPNLERV
jgi:7,8-dihydroneopterin aldolase/epimerase/oxygenase